MTSEYTWEGDQHQHQSRDSDDEIVQRAKAGEDDAWSEIFASSYPKIYRYILGRTGSADAAEDLASAVFLEAIKSIDSFSPRGKPLLAWLYSIARNLANHHHRTNYRRADLERKNAASITWATAGESEDPEDMWATWDLHAAVQTLSGDQREVIILRFLAGLTTPEVARVVGKSERAVYSLYTRALQAMRTELSADEGE